MSLPYPLLHLLADGRFHSGEVLGRTLGISRSAVWKQLKQLQALQIPLYSVPGRGYQIPHGLELLDAERIKHDCKGLVPALHLFPELDSTNRYLMDLARQGVNSPQLCLAERQTAGRGRRGRAWVSPFAANLYFSLLWPFSSGAAALSGLSLGVALALCKVLETVGLQGARVKWPNDLLVEGRKLSGILLEMCGDAGGPCQVVIGIGVNIAMPVHEGSSIDQPWTDLSSQLTSPLSRNRLAALLLDELTAFLPRFEQEGLTPWLDEWRARDALLNAEVELVLPHERVAGRWRGIDASGAGLFETEAGVRRVLAGDVSLRRAS